MPFTRKIIYTFHLPSNPILRTKNLKRERAAWESHNLWPPKPESNQIAPPHSPPCVSKYFISISSSLFFFLPWLFFSRWPTSAPLSYSNPSPISMPKLSNACTWCTQLNPPQFQHPSPWSVPLLTLWPQTHHWNPKVYPFSLSFSLSLSLYIYIYIYLSLFIYL